MVSQEECKDEIRFKGLYQDLKKGVKIADEVQRKLRPIFKVAWDTDKVFLILVLGESVKTGS
jgi:hypothetical protein